MKKRVLFIVSLLLFSSMMNAEGFCDIINENCYYSETNGENESNVNERSFTSLESESLSIFSTSYFLKRVDDATFMSLILVAPSSFILKEDDDFVFQTTKGNIITLNLSEKLIGDITYAPLSSDGSKISVTVPLPLSKNLYNQFLTEKVAKFRLYTGSVYKGLKANKAEKLQEYFKCVLNSDHNSNCNDILNGNYYNDTNNVAEEEKPKEISMFQKSEEKYNLNHLRDDIELRESRRKIRLEKNRESEEKIKSSKMMPEDDSSIIKSIYSTNYRLEKVEQKDFMNLTIISPTSFKLQEGDDFFFQTNKGNVITLKLTSELIDNIIYTPSPDSSTWSAKVLLPISDDTHTQLLSERAVKFRLYTGNDLYRNFDKINKKEQLVVKDEKNKFGEVENKLTSKENKEEKMEIVGKKLKSDLNESKQIFASPQVISSTSYSLSKVGADGFINLNIVSLSSFNLKKGDDLFFQTDNGNEIVLKITEELIDNITYNHSERSAKILMPVSDEAFNQLLTEKITKFRLYTGKSYRDFDDNSSRDYDKLRDREEARFNKYQKDLDLLKKDNDSEEKLNSENEHDYHHGDFQKNKSFTTSYLLKKIDGESFVDLTIISSSSFTLKKEDELFFKTNKGNDINLNLSEEIIENIKYVNSSDISEWSAMFSLPVSDEIYKKLLSEKITKFRLYSPKIRKVKNKEKELQEEDKKPDLISWKKNN